MHAPGGRLSTNVHCCLAALKKIIPLNKSTKRFRKFFAKAYLLPTEKPFLYPAHINAPGKN